MIDACGTAAQPRSRENEGIGTCGEVQSERLPPLLSLYGKVSLALRAPEDRVKATHEIGSDRIAYARLADPRVFAARVGPNDPFPVAGADSEIQRR